MPQTLIDCWKCVSNRAQHVFDRYSQILKRVGSQEVDIHGNDRPLDDSSDVFHDYEVALPFVEVPFEQEPFFRYVDRASAEDVLRNRVDGSFLVRPFKEQSITIKYIVTVYAKEEFFHLYIRHSDGKYAMGQPKNSEIQFRKPADIINYFRLNQLMCKNQRANVKVFLVPIA